jgi:hypothetical protein
MSHLKSTLTILLAVCIFGSALVACSSAAPTPPAYDPNKKYVAFAVVNVPAAADILSTAKQQAAADGFEIGPVEYYSPQNPNFDALVKKLTESKQITLIWVVGGVMDVPAIRKSATKLGYSGSSRFSPVAGQSMPGQ